MSGKEKGKHWISVGVCLGIKIIITMDGNSWFSRKESVQSPPASFGTSSYRVPLLVDVIEVTHANSPYSFRKGVTFDPLRIYRLGLEACFFQERGEGLGRVEVAQSLFVPL